MAIFINLAMSLVQSAHGTAFLIGGVAYLGYMSLMVSPAPNSESKDTDSDSQPTRSRLRERLPLGLWSLFAAVLAAYLLAAPARDSECPAPEYETALPSDFEGLGSLGGYEGDMDAADLGDTPAASGTTPSALLKEANAALDGGDDETGRGKLSSCIKWTPAAAKAEGEPELEELQAHLECHGEYLEQGTNSVREAAALAASGRRILRAARKRGAEDPKAFLAIQVEWARVVHGSLQVHFDVATQLVRAQRNKAPHGPAAIAALAAVGATRSPFEDSLRATAVALQELLREGSQGVEEASELRHHLAASRVSILGLAREAHQLASEVKAQAAGDNSLLRDLRCPAEALEQVEKLAVKEGEREAATEGLIRPQALFALGEYYSELAVDEGADASTESRWILDVNASGVHVPASLVRAETLLAEGAEGGADDDRAERSAMRALRLYHHAKVLAKRHHDAAAEWRYRASAKISARYKRNKLAAHSLSRLAYLYVQRGRKTEAFEVLKEAQKFGGNALTVYLKTVLLRGSGQLTTDADLRASDAALQSVAGKLPSKALEDQRTALHAEVQFWHAVAEGSVWRCFGAKDVAHLLICIICRLLWPGAPENPETSAQGAEEEEER